MSKRIPFTTEQMQILNENPYTAQVSACTVRFTLEFKEFFFREYLKGNTTSTGIFEKAGYSREILGSERMYKAQRNIMKEGRSPQGLQPPKGRTKEEQMAAFAKADLSKKHKGTAIKELQDKVVHLEQQVEFLKKIAFLEQTGRPPAERQTPGLNASKKPRQPV